MKYPELKVKNAVLLAEIEILSREIKENRKRVIELESTNDQLKIKIGNKFSQIENNSQKYDDFCFENKVGEFSDEAMNEKSIVFRLPECIFQYCPNSELCAENGCRSKSNDNT